ncbi:PHD-finger domain-containing protein [Metarhizium album ARSEF 1941]|uniref:PHD-finger domain-containing protein n=1 Tax=Metarhizium album (strain ARSEF 1941) TaxID=1081103 RepID=A0A0B2WRA4_METAS|nr:PHD-finger domain-containing protein [Metarhizium album ARSEF 1941]KHN98591.1 PHD-finger domain-containing protein [Metarhizium album ARSEF 1941]
MPSKKRATHSNSGDEPPSTLHRIRNMWQFANLCQWIYMFGKAAKIDDAVDIEEVEADCLKPQPTLLPDLALALLKLVSTHRGLTPDVMDDHLRRQYLAKAPRQNPFGSETDPVSFTSLDVFTKRYEQINVLQKLTQWTMVHPERLREKMAEHKDTEQSNWRIEPYGWDKHDRVYYVLDDNRIYRFTEPQSPGPQLKPKKMKQYRIGRRASKRRHTASPSEGGGEDLSDRQYDSQLPEDDLGGGTWECIAITLQEARAFVETLAKTRDGNEKTLRRQLETHLLPILEKQEEVTKRRELQRERELLSLAKMANAKRSSRIADKAEKKKRDVEEKEEQRQKLEAERAEHREKIARLKLEKERDFRIQHVSPSDAFMPKSSEINKPYRTLGKRMMIGSSIAFVDYMARSTMALIALPVNPATFGSIASAWGSLRMKQINANSASFACLAGVEKMTKIIRRRL